LVDALVITLFQMAVEISSDRFWSAAIFGDKKTLQADISNYPFGKKGSFESDYEGFYVPRVILFDR
jgi:hypothetical protein